MNTFALPGDKECGTFSGTATRCIICAEVSLRYFFVAAEVELLAAGLRFTLFQALLFCLRGYRQLRETIRQMPRQVAEPRGYEISSVIFLLAATIAMMGCSVRKFAVNKLGDSLANSGTTFASDNDPEFVGQAIPFSLKLIEGLLAESPRHRGLLFAAASGFTQYSYGYVQQSSEQVELEDVNKSRALAERARNLYLRARDYGLRGLETKHRGFAGSLRENPRAAVRMAKSGDVPLLYWTAVAWGAAISLSKDRPDLVAEQPQVEALIDRAYELNRDFEHGAIEQFLITYESARQGAKGDFAARCKEHFDRAVALSNGQLASPYVAYAETVSLQKQNRGEFELLLRKALAVDPDNRAEWRLSNLVMQRRARWLLSREDDLFLDGATAGGSK